MAAGYRNTAGVDFDSLFDPFQEGTPPANTGFRDLGGVDLAGRYAPISFGTKGPNVGYRTSATLDVSNLWAAIGTAVYAVLGVPTSMEDFKSGVQGGGGVTATVTARWQRDGDTSWATGGVFTGEWYPGGAATIGDDYDIRFTQTASSGGGTFTGTLNTWMQINADRVFTFSVSRNVIGTSGVLTRTILVEIRRRSDNAVVVSASIDLSVEAEIEAA